MNDKQGVYRNEIHSLLKYRMTLLYSELNTPVVMTDRSTNYYNLLDIPGITENLYGKEARSKIEKTNYLHFLFHLAILSLSPPFLSPSFFPLFLPPYPSLLVFFHPFLFLPPSSFLLSFFSLFSSFLFPCRCFLSSFLFPPSFLFLSVFSGKSLSTQSSLAQ